MWVFLFSAVCRICTDKHNKQLSIGMEIEDEIRGNNIKDEVRKLYLLEREWISGYVANYYLA
jgi:hypothetical protein